MVEKGATTIWESWNAAGSHNHPALGCIGAWFYEGLGGIRPNPETPGFKNFVIRPLSSANLTWTKSRYDSVYGTIRCDWKREGRNLDTHLIIPPTQQPRSIFPPSVWTPYPKGNPWQKTPPA